MFSGGPEQTHVGTGGGGSSSDMPLGEKKNDCNMITLDGNGYIWSQNNKKTNFITREMQIFGVF